MLYSKWAKNMANNDNQEDKKKGIFRRGAGYFKNEAEQIISRKELEKGADVIKNLSRDVLKKRTGRNEKFFEAVQRMNLKPEQVLNNYRLFRMSFFINLACLSGTFLLMIVFIFFGKVWSLLTGAGASSLFLVSCATFSFRAFQIRKMKLCDFQEWFERRDAWIPKKINEKRWIVYWEKMVRNKQLKRLDLIPIDYDKDLDQS